MSDSSKARQYSDDIMRKATEIVEHSQNVDGYAEESALNSRAIFMALGAIHNELRYGHDQQTRLAETINSLDVTLQGLPGLRADPPNG